MREYSRQLTGPGFRHDPFIGHGYFPLAGMVIFSLLAILALLVLYRLATRWLDQGHSGSANALSIARERYAKGQINHDEYLKLVKNLEK